mmetsp:Transcript_26907/g.46367  ORF Transcript_26907/g.46367 Transcript_26907/m.46367 type:complete len:181 (-) Transcript_26907:887-1429(-)
MQAVRPSLPELGRKFAQQYVKKKGFAPPGSVLAPVPPPECAAGDAATTKQTVGQTSESKQRDDTAETASAEPQGSVAVKSEPSTLIAGAPSTTSITSISELNSLPPEGSSSPSPATACVFSSSGEASIEDAPTPCIFLVDNQGRAYKELKKGERLLVDAQGIAHAPVAATPNTTPTPIAL